MSLFASAFESGTTAGPSTPIGSNNNGKNKNKRKRPSTGPATPVNGDDQLRAAQKNLEKLMKSIEGAEGPGNKGLKGHKSQEKSPFGQKDKGKKDNLKRDDSNAAASPAKKQKGNQGPQNSSQIKPAKTESAADPVKQSKKEKKRAVEIPMPIIPTSNDEDAAGLTSLQKGMKAKLEGARFRWINEQLYTTPSTEAVDMMKKDPKIFADYHMTHRVLTAAWPSPPLPYIIERISPLPAGTVVADLGCGDAGLARALVSKGKVVLSYDLVSDQSPLDGISKEDVRGEGWVVQADFITHVPLPGRPGGASVETIELGKKKDKKGKQKVVGSEIVDVVVCCLSLMGTNWVGGIYEACRILKEGGTFHVAEVTSRFISTEAFVEKVKSFGFQLENEESPSTHFTLFKFTKTSTTPIGPVRGQRGWEERVKEGEEILQACVYKKR